MEITFAQLAPLASLPFNSIHIDGAVLPEKPGNHTVESIGYVSYQHGVDVAPQHINHARQRVGKCAQILGFNAGQINQPHTLVRRRPFLEERFAAINNYLMPTLHQPRSQFDEKRFRAAIRRGYSAASENREPEFAAINWMILCGR